MIGTPRPVRLAIAMMLVAAAASLVQAVLIMVHWEPMLARNVPRTVHTVTGPYLATLGATIRIGSGIAAGAIGLVAWSRTARAASKRRPWTRVVATTLGGLAILVYLLSFTLVWPTAVHIPATVGIVAAVAAVVLLYHPAWSTFTARD